MLKIFTISLSLVWALISEQNDKIICVLSDVFENITARKKEKLSKIVTRLEQKLCVFKNDYWTWSQMIK